MDGRHPGCNHVRRDRRQRGPLRGAGGHERAAGRGERIMTEATIADYLLARSGDTSVGMQFEDQTWTWDEYVQACADRAAWLRSLHVGEPFHVGVLLDNVPEFPILLGAAALSGAVIVGLNPTRRGAEQTADIERTDCRLIVTEERYAAEVESVDLRVFVVDRPGSFDMRTF